MGFDDLDVASLEVVADYLAVAITNARLFTQAREAAVLAEPPHHGFAPAADEEEPAQGRGESRGAAREPEDLDDLGDLFQPGHNFGREFPAHPYFGFITFLFLLTI